MLGILFVYISYALLYGYCFPVESGIDKYTVLFSNFKLLNLSAVTFRLFVQYPCEENPVSCEVVAVHWSNLSVVDAPYF